MKIRELLAVFMLLFAVAAAEDIELPARATFLGCVNCRMTRPYHGAQKWLTYHSEYEPKITWDNKPGALPVVKFYDEKGRLMEMQMVEREWSEEQVEELFTSRGFRRIKKAGNDEL